MGIIATLMAIGFVVFLAAVGALWWWFLVIRPSMVSLKAGGPPHIVPMLVLLSLLVPVIFTLLLGDLVYTGIALLLPSPTLFGALYSALKMKLLWALGSVAALGVVSVLLIRKFWGHYRFTITLLSAVVLGSAPLAVQGHFSDRMILREYEKLGADCLSVQSFYASVRDRKFPQKFHAMAVRGEIYYIWSYRDRSFSLLQHDKEYGVLSYAPDMSCR